MSGFGTGLITLRTAHSLFCPFPKANSVSSATCKLFAVTKFYYLLSLIQYISIMAFFVAYLPFLTKKYFVKCNDRLYTCTNEKKPSVKVILLFVANSSVTICFSTSNFSSSDNISLDFTWCVTESRLKTSRAKFDTFVPIQWCPPIVRKYPLFSWYVKFYTSTFYSTKWSSERFRSEWFSRKWFFDWNRVFLDVPKWYRKVVQNWHKYLLSKFLNLYQRLLP